MINVITFLEQEGLSNRQIKSTLKGKNPALIFYTKNKIKIGNVYYSGLINFGDSIHFVSKKYSKSFYICEDCKKFTTYSYDAQFKKPNPDSGKILCQKCSCKYTNNRKSKREKNSKTIKKRWENGELENLRELYRQNRIEFNKTIQMDKIKNFDEDKKLKIRNKKRKTFYSKTKKERDEVNNRRAIGFKEWNKKSHERKLEYLENLTNEQLLKAREYNYITGEEWDVVRKKTLKNANYKCQKCGEKKKLDIHHIVPFAINGNNNNLIALCRSCHQKVEWKFRKKYEETNDLLESKIYSLEGTEMEGYSIKEAAEKLKVSRQVIYYWIKNEKITHFIKNGKKRISFEEVNRLIKEQNYG